MRIGIARDGTATLAEDIEVHMTSNKSSGPILGPSHDGGWIILRAATNNRIIRWVCITAGCKACPDPVEEISRETGAIRWMEVRT